VTKARKDNTTGLKEGSILRIQNSMVKKDIKSARLQRPKHLLNLSKGQFKKSQKRSNASHKVDTIKMAKNGTTTTVTNRKIRTQSRLKVRKRRRLR
jgi:hypothetical protein